MEANNASLVSGDVTSRAQELRATLGARQVAETLLAEAGRVRQDAALAADAMVAEAQQLSEQLVAESRRTAEQVAAEAQQLSEQLLADSRRTAEQVAAEAQQLSEQLVAESRRTAEQVAAEAREQANAVLSQARAEAEELAAHARANAEALRSAAEAEVEEHRRRVRAEVTALVTQELTEQHRAAEAAAREESEAVVSDLEASVRILGVSLETALGNVSELLGSLEALRPTDPRATPAPAPAPVPAERQAPPSRPGGAHLVDTPFGLEPLPAATTSVPSASSPFGTEGDTPGQADETDHSRPRSATEAFLSSSSLEIEQASRELRDLQHPEEARRRRGDESKQAAQRSELDDDVATDGEPEPGDDAARPLGWLFRTAH